MLENLYIHETTAKYGSKETDQKIIIDKAAHSTMNNFKKLSEIFISCYSFGSIISILKLRKLSLEM